MPVLQAGETRCSNPGSSRLLQVRRTSNTRGGYVCFLSVFSNGRGPGTTYAVMGSEVALQSGLGDNTPSPRYKDVQVEIRSTIGQQYRHQHRFTKFGMLLGLDMWLSNGNRVKLLYHSPSMNASPWP